MSIAKCLAIFPVEGDDLDAIKRLVKGPDDEGKAVDFYLKKLRKELDGVRQQLIANGHGVQKPVKPKLDAQGNTQRLASADKAVDKAVRSIIAADKDLSQAELKKLAEEIKDRILSTPDGRLSYDAPSGGPKVGPPSEREPQRGPLAHRSFMIPDELIEPWLENDIEKIGHAYLSTMGPDVALAERFDGSVEMDEEFRKLRDETAQKTAAATSDAERDSIRAEYDANVNDLSVMRDRIRGTYGKGQGNPMRNAGRWAQSIGHANTLLHGGGFGISQLTDPTAPIMRYGFHKVFRDGYLPLLKALTNKQAPAREAIRQYQAMGIATDMHMTMSPLAEVGEEYSPHTKTERALKTATNYYMIANLAAPITTGAKMLTAIITGNEILSATKALTAGKATAKQIADLGQASITPELAARISEQFEKGGVIKDGTYLPNTADWTDEGARRTFEGAVSQEVNRIVVTPGQEKAIWISGPIGRLIGQFKSFTGSATTRILLANLQRRDAAVLQGLFAQVAMGMLGYKAYMTAAGKDTSDRPQDWIKEGISRSGMLGWLDEGNALASKFTGGQADMYRLIGADKPGSRYASRNWASQLGGPTIGTMQDGFTLLSALANGDITRGDLSAGKHLIPFNNLFYIRRGLDEVEKASAEVLGLPERRQPRKDQ